MRLFHATNKVVLQPGDELLPHSKTGNSLWDCIYARPEEAWRSERVWMAASPDLAADWVGGWYQGGDTHVYAVEAEEVEVVLSSDDEESPDFGMPPQYHARSAIILAEVPSPWRVSPAE